MSPEEVKIDEQVRGNRYVGIGVQIRLNPGEKRAMLVTPFRGSPAHRAGLKPRDLLLEIDGKSTEGEALGPLVQRLRGAEGTTVTLVVRQPEEKESRRVKLTRSVVPFENVQGYRRANGDRIWDFRVEPTGAIAYAVVRSITSSTLHELRQLDRRLRDDKAKALILDLRLGNGGELQHCALVADGLLDGGTLWKVRDARGQVKARKADRDCLFRDMPIVVLVSQPVLRGVPWLAAALQDNGRAVIVGEALALSPFAHGEVDLPDGGKLVLATGRLERAKKPGQESEPAERTGLGTASRFVLEPDHVVTLSQKQRGALAEWFHTKDYTELPGDVRDDPPEDPGLTKAIEVLRARRKGLSSVRGQVND
jgi:carboxyl-terminal processing protease